MNNSTKKNKTLNYLLEVNVTYMLLFNIYKQNRDNVRNK